MTGKSHTPIDVKTKVFAVLLTSSLLLFTSFARTITVGYYAAPGMMNGAKEGEVKSGYAYDYIQEMSSYGGWRFRYVYGSFGELYEKLRRGEIDMLPYVTKTDARAKEVLFPKMAMGEERIFLGARKPERVGGGGHAGRVTLPNALAGKKIGVIKGAFYNELVRRQIETNGGVGHTALPDAVGSRVPRDRNACEFVEYATAEEKDAAMEKGEIDYVVELSTSTQKIDLYAVHEFDVRYPFHLAVAWDKPDLLRELDAVQEYTENVQPGFRDGLKRKYFKRNPVFKALSEESRKWFAEHKALRIGAYNHDAPYVIEKVKSKSEKGKSESEGGGHAGRVTLPMGDNMVGARVPRTRGATGIAPDYVDVMLKALRLDIPVEWKVYDGRESALAALRTGEIDLINPYNHNYGDAESDGVIISNPAFEVNFGVLYEGDFSRDTMSVIATPHTRLGARYVRDNYPGARIVPCQDGYDCIRKFLAGEATCVVMHIDALEKIASEYRRDFRLKALNTKCAVSFAALSSNAALIGAIDRAIPFLTDVELNIILNRYNIERSPGVSFAEFCRRRPEYAFAGLGLLLLAAIVAVVFVVRSKRRQEQLLTFANYLTNNFFSSYYINLRTHEFKVFKRTDELDREYPVIPDYMESLKAYNSNAVHPDDRVAFASFVSADNLRRLLQTKPIVVHTFREITGLGDRTFRLTVVRGADENYAAFAFSDVTEEVKAEERRLKEETEFAQVREEQRKNDMLHEIVHSGKWRFFLNAQDEVTGAEYSAEVQRVIGNDLPNDNPHAWSEIVHPDDRDTVRVGFRAAIADHSCRTPYDVTYRMKDRNGVYHWFHSAGRIIRQQDGSGEFFGVHIDITDQIEERLRQQREQERQKHLQMFGRMMNAATWTIDVKGEAAVTAVEWSEEFRRMLGFSDERDFPNVLGSWFDQLDPADRARAYEHFNRCIRSREERLVYDIDVRVKRKSGECHVYHAYGRIELLPGDARRLYGILIDVTAAKELESNRD